MKKATRRVFWVLWMVLAGALPAYANNPPQPDGMLSLILIFPAVILGSRLAKVEGTEDETRWRIPRGIFLGLAALVAAAGTEIGGIAMLILLFYGIFSAGRAIRRGQGARRFAIGAALILYSFFACGDYLLSLNSWPPHTETWGLSTLRNIATAETTFKTEKRLDANKNGIGEYGSLQDLVRALYLDEAYTRPQGRSGYRSTVVVTGNAAEDEKGFFAYTSPVDYGPAESAVWQVIPGGSWVKAFRPQRYPARRTFAVDETGVVREADLGRSRPVSREETQNWNESKR